MAWNRRLTDGEMDLEDTLELRHWVAVRTKLFQPRSEPESLPSAPGRRPGSPRRVPTAALPESSLRDVLREETDRVRAALPRLLEAARRLEEPGAEAPSEAGAMFARYLRSVGRDEAARRVLRSLVE